MPSTLPCIDNGVDVRYEKEGRAEAFVDILKRYGESNPRSSLLVGTSLREKKMYQYTTTP